MKYLFRILLFSFLVPITAFSQEEDSSEAKDQISVFLDCDFCDSSYIRREITFVNYAIDRNDADLHVIVTRQNNGGGGRLFTLDYIGQNIFEGQKDKLTAQTLPNDTDDRQRVVLTQMLKIGFVKFVAQTPSIDNVSISYNGQQTRRETSPSNEDRWNNWVFRVNGSGEINTETSRDNFQWSGNFSASRVTDLWKTSIDANTRYNRTDYDFTDTTITSTTTRHTVFGRVVRSLSDHWSTKMTVFYNVSSFSNIDLRLSLSPGIEYSIFPYSESNRRALTARYELNLAKVDYVEETIYGKLSENLLEQEVSLGLSLTEPWGSARVRINGSSYFHDFGKHSFSLQGGLDLRISRGLSLDIGGGASLIRNQISLPSRGATDEEILLRQKELAKDFEIGFEVGLTYRFGAIFNNVVNTRFDNGFFRF